MAITGKSFHQQKPVGLYEVEENFTRLCYATTEQNGIREEKGKANVERSVVFCV